MLLYPFSRSTVFLVQCYIVTNVRRRRREGEQGLLLQLLLQDDNVQQAQPGTSIGGCIQESLLSPHVRNRYVRPVLQSVRPGAQGGEVLSVCPEQPAEHKRFLAVFVLQWMCDCDWVRGVRQRVTERNFAYRAGGHRDVPDAPDAQDNACHSVSTNNPTSSTMKVSRSSQLRIK